MAGLDQETVALIRAIKESDKIRFEKDDSYIEASESTPLPVTSSNVTGVFREAFESFTPGEKYNVVGTGAGDLVFLDGNAAAASYLVVSKDPLQAGTEVSITSIQTADIPVEVSIGLSMSQRTLGQDFALEVIDDQSQIADVLDLAILSITQALSVLTIDTVLPHGMSVGKSIGVFGCSNPLANYPSLVVATVPSPTQFTVTAGPGGTIPSQTITNPVGAKGSVYFRQRLGRSQNGISQIFENATVTNSSLYIRSESGDALPSGTVAGNHSIAIATTASIQAAGNVPYTYSFSPSTEYRYNIQADRTQWSDSIIDTVAQPINRLLRTQVCPDPSQKYKLRIRATNNKALTVPNAQVISYVKASAITTAMVTTDVAHGLAIGDPVVMYGARDQVNFPNLLVATAVASIVSSTIFTIVCGPAAAATSYGGYVAKVNGGNLMSTLGASAVVAASAVLATLSDGTRQLTITGNTTWAAGVIGDIVNVVGMRADLTGVSLGVDGPWKIANQATTILTLVLPFSGQRVLPADFGSANCGGAVIKRTDMRVSFGRVFEFKRERVEILSRPVGDMSGAVPMVAQGGTITSVGTVTTVSTVTSLTTLANGQTAHSTASTGSPLRIAGRVVPTTIATVDTTLVAGDASDAGVTSAQQLITKNFGTSELDYASSLLPVVTTTTPQSIVAASGTASVRNYITQLSIQTDLLGAAGNMFILDNQGAIGTSVTIATPGVFTSTAHDLKVGDVIIFTAIGTITGISVNTMYFVTATTLAATTFTIALTPGGTAIAITGSTAAFTFYRVFNMFRLNTAALATPVIINPISPYRGIANSNLNVYFPTSLVTGTVYLNVNGYKGF
jgi:hypothetical protein